MSAFEPKLTVVFRDGQTGGEHAATLAGEPFTLRAKIKVRRRAKKRS